VHVFDVDRIGISAAANVQVNETAKREGECLESGGSYRRAIERLASRFFYSGCLFSNEDSPGEIYPERAVGVRARPFVAARASARA